MDWNALMDHRITPPLTPNARFVNAEETVNINPAAYITGVKITPADDEKHYKDFNHIMSHYWQEEILEQVATRYTSKFHRRYHSL